MTMWEQNPQRLVDQLKNDIARIYPQLGDVEFEHVWTGVLGNTIHRMPQIGEVSPRVWLASGFGGHGLNTTAMAGNVVARAIAEGDDTWRLFLPFELVWAGGRIGRALAQVHYWWFRARELRKADEARGRELELRRNEESSAPPAEPRVSEQMLSVTVEYLETTSAQQPVSASRVDESGDLDQESAAAAGLQTAGSRKKPRGRKTNDTSDAVSTSDASAEVRAAGGKKKTSRRAKRTPPLDTENV
jgi:gamma-glutamylputrescine oxidase